MKVCTQKELKTYEIPGHEGSSISYYEMSGIDQQAAISPNVELGFLVKILTTEEVASVQENDPIKIIALMAKYPTVKSALESSMQNAVLNVRNIILYPGVIEKWTGLTDMDDNTIECTPKNLAHFLDGNDEELALIFKELSVLIQGKLLEKDPEKAKKEGKKRKKNSNE